MNRISARRKIMGRDLVLWLAGVPIGVIIVLHLLGILR
jgi:hypothetical protein